METEITLTVNGERRTVRTDPQRTLLEVLREDLALTGTKYGCGEGRCGACAVLIDGRRTLACQTELAEADGKSITTIEGLAPTDKLHPVQKAFLAEGAAQCGYCTPGMILSTVFLLEHKPHPTEDEIRAGLDPNLCRCCNYPKIVRAVDRAARTLAKEDQS